MSLTQAWQAIVNPEVILNTRAWEAFILGDEVPETGGSLIVWNIRLPRVFVASWLG